MKAAEAQLRILFADDEPGTRALMRAVLRKLDLEVTLACDGVEALALFRSAPHDMVLLDVDMPGLDGFEVCRQLRQEAGELLPIVMVTGMDDMVSVERAYEVGATDFFSKPINWTLLGHRLRHLIRNQLAQLRLKSAEMRIQMLADSLRHANLNLRRANEELQRQAFEDPLCGLPNRALFNNRLHHALQRHARQAAHASTPAQLAVMFIDLDGFKPINDSFGHAAGDEILRDVARRLRTAIRESDTLARLGGDEFVTLIETPEAGADASRLGRRIIETLNRPFAIGPDKQVSLSCSIGIVVYPDQEADGLRLLACADAAMYAAKRAGGSTCVVYEPGMSENGAEQLLMQQALREAIDRNELSLDYQPKVGGRDGRVHGFEALLRWNHPHFGSVSPVVFIPLAERYGLIGTIGSWVIDQVCAQLSAWRAQDFDCRIAVNLSPHQLRQGDLTERMVESLRRHDLRPDQLVCEITETAMMENTEDERGTLDQLAAVGVWLSIDDFGTGYSSLAHLRVIPARQLKIDRSFILDLTTSRRARAMVEAVVQLAHALQMEVVAEGVETKEQLRALQELGCDLIQGFYIARPMPAEAVLAWVGAREQVLSEGRDTGFGVA